MRVLSAHAQGGGRATAIECRRHAVRQQCTPTAARRPARLIVMAAAKPVLMVNSCTGNMGRAVAEAAVRAGLQLAPFTLCGAAEAGGVVEVAGTSMQLVGPDTRDAVIDQARRRGMRRQRGLTGRRCCAGVPHAHLHAILAIDRTHTRAL